MGTTGGHSRAGKSDWKKGKKMLLSFTLLTAMTDFSDKRDIKVLLLLGWWYL